MSAVEGHLPRHFGFTNAIPEMDVRPPRRLVARTSAAREKEKKYGQKTNDTNKMYG